MIIIIFYFYDSKNNEYLSHAVYKISIQFEKIEIHKKLVFDEIDLVKQK